MKALEIFYEMKHYLSLEWSDLEDLDIIEKSLKALEVLKECFDFEGFDEFIPNDKWFEKDIKEREEILKELTK